MKRAISAAVDLPEREWEFSDCPKDEIYDCWLYEFAREIGWLKDAVERRRRQTQIDTLTRFARETFYSFLLRPDWPAQPYLSASPEERRKWIAWTRLQTDQEIHAEFLIPDSVPKGAAEWLASSLTQLGRPRIRSKSGRLELALLRIDWAMPNSFLVQAFESYLKEFRPLNPGPLNPDLPISHTGKTEPDSKRLRQLEQLGRWRLLRANGKNIKLARATGHLKTCDAKPWSRARRAVEELLDNAETRIVPQLSRVELENYGSLTTPSKSQ